jgi:hypothetical protein
MERSPPDFEPIRIYDEVFTTYDALATFLENKHENFRTVFRIISFSDSINPDR